MVTAEMIAIRFLSLLRMLLPSLWPGRALIFRHVGHALEVELLDSLSFERLDCVDVALGVGGDGVHGEEFARLPTAFTEARELVERLPIENVDLHVLPVGDVEVLLIAIAREADAPDGAGAFGVWRNGGLLH